MRAIDYFLRILTVAAAIGLLFLPNKIGFRLLCASFFAVGLWSILFPPGIIGWARTAHPELDPLDTSLWWLPRFLGALFIAFSVLAIVLFR